MGHLSTPNHGCAHVGHTQHIPFPFVTPAQVKEGFYEYVHVCEVAAWAWGEVLFLSWSLTLGYNNWKGKDS